jgi:hypothetical protein
MRVAGVQLTEGAVARLAQLLDKAGHKELAMRVGLAVDTNQPHLRLHRPDLKVIALLLEDGPEEFTDLRGAILQVV